MPQQPVPDFIPDNVSPSTSVPDFIPDTTPTNNSPSQLEQMIMDEYNPQPSALERIWSAMSSPLWEGPMRAGRAVSDYLTTPVLPSENFKDVPVLGAYEQFGNDLTARMRGLTGGAMEGVGNFASQLTSPIDLAAAALTGGSSLAAKQGLSGTARGLNTLARVASAPVAAHGAYGVYEGAKEGDLAQAGMGLAELAGGVAGMAQHAPTDMMPEDLSVPTQKPKVRVNRDGTFTDIDNGITFDSNGRIVIPEGQELTRDSDFFIKNRPPESAIPVEDISHSRDFDPTGGQPTPFNRTNQDPRWVEAESDARKLGIDPLQFEHIEDLEWAITQKVAQETHKTGVNPLNNIDKPSNARSFEVNEETGRPNIYVGGADPRVLDVLATSLYTKSMPNTVTKELLQNSLDEMKITNNPNPVKVVLASGDINPITNEPAPSVTVKDYGRGMTEDQLYTIFTDVGKTGKADEPTASGGFGFAKAAPLLGGDYARVESVVFENGEKIKYSFAGTREQFNNAQKSGVPLNREVMPPNTRTGLTVQTYFKPEEGLYGTKDLVSEIVKGSPYVKNVHVIEDYSYKGETGKKFLNDQLTPIEERDTQVHRLQGEPIPEKKATLRVPGSDVDIHFKLDDKERANGKLVILNNGLYVSSQTIRYAQEAVPHVPDRIVIDIKANVEEGTPNYPFGANREAISEKVTKAYNDWIDENIKKPASGRAQDEIQRLYDNLQPVGGNRFVIHDSGNKYTPQELARVQSSPTLMKIGIVYENLLNSLTKHFAGETLGDYEKFGFLISGETSGGVNIPNPSAKNTSGKAASGPAGEALRKAKAAAKKVGLPESAIDDLMNPPNRKKYAILVDPFSAAMNSSSPNDAAQRIVHIIMHEFNHNFVRSEGAGYTWSLAKIEGRFPLEERINAKNTIRQALTGPDGGYAPEFQELLREYQESRRRPVTKPDILSRQRESEWATDPRQARTSSSSRPNGTGISPEVSEAVAKKRSTILLTPNKNSIFDMRHAVESGYKHAGLDENGRIKMVFTGKPKQVGVLESDIGNKRGGRGRNAKPKEQSTSDEIINFPRAIMASTDFSAPLRQGLPLIHKKAFWTSLDDMFKAWGSEKAYDGIMQEINSRPLFKKRAGPENTILPSFAEDAGLKLSGIDSIAGREEALQSTWAEMLPFVRRSNRAYTAFLNKLRADTFENLVNNNKIFSPGSETNVALAKELANFVNTASGRGSLGRLESSAKFLNATLFAPRLIASRLQLLNPHYYWAANPVVRKEAMKSLLAVVGTGVALGQLAKMAGAEVSANPTSADFGKIKIGNFRLDPFAGFQQYAVLAARLISGQVQSTTTGNTYNLGEKFGRPTRLDILGRFAEGKANPIISFVTGLLRGKDFVGKPFDVPEELASRLTPIYLQDLKEILTENPDLIPFYHDDGAYQEFHPENLPYAIPPAFGMGMQNYGTMK